MDFYLDQPWNGYHTLMRDYLDGADRSYFKKDADSDIHRFLDQYQDWYDRTRGQGHISLITCNHDTFRPRYNLDEQELKLAYAFIFTMPGVPFLYYGDEIGMRYLKLPTKEGGYIRTGSRTPMQWKSGLNLGFSEGCPDSLYLPVDPAADAPTVEGQEADPRSLLNTVKALLALRGAYEDLQADGDFEVLAADAGQPFVYRRGQIYLAVNPSGKTLEAPVRPEGRHVIYAIGGCEAREDAIVMAPQSFAILERA